MTQPTFAMMACAHGAETCVKEEIAAAGWRLAFSRPGFITAKHDTAQSLPQGIFTRTSAHSLGSAKGEQASDLTERLLETLASIPHGFDHLHVWPRDRVPIGKFDFEPGIDEVSAASAKFIFERLPEGAVRAAEPNCIAAPGQSILDVILVEPSHWFFGHHEVVRTPDSWPGGVQPIQPQYEPISRAYYKAAEAIAWSGFELRAGDTAVEVGSAPGGACGRLLEMGMRVIGVDPAEMDPRIQNHPRFRHLPARAGELPRRNFRGAKWLLVDSNVKPDATLSTVENLVQSSETDFHGLLITMKLGQYDRADQIPRWRDRVAKWQPQEIQVRQLARNRCEVCFAVRMR